jgi:hypothetical protein
VHLGQRMEFRSFLWGTQEIRKRSEADMENDKLDCFRS